MPLLEISTEINSFDWGAFEELNDERFDGRLDAIPCETQDIVIVIVPTVMCDQDLDDAIFLLDNAASMD